VTLNWFCNASYQFDLVSDLAPAYAFSLVPEAFRLEDYVRVGARPVYFQEAANPSFYHPVDVPRDLDVAFVGARYGDRSRYLRRLVENGVDVHVWGPGWESVLRDESPLLGPCRLAREARRRLSPRGRTARFLPCGAGGGTLPDAEMVSVFSRAKISLGFSRVGPSEASATPIHQVRLRDFEATMSGAFYLLEYFEEIEQFFALDKEIVCFSDEGELVEKVRFYLAHDAVREKIRVAGRDRALADHTWQKRFEQLFASLGLG
jgi:spore maturation protein CgeB